MITLPMPEYPRRYRLGLIEAISDFTSSRGTDTNIRGVIASASLKQGYKLFAEVSLSADIRGVIASASLKRGY